MTDALVKYVAARVKAEVDRRKEFIISTAFSYGFDVYVAVVWRDHDIFIDYVLARPDSHDTPLGFWTLYRCAYAQVLRAARRI